MGYGSYTAGDWQKLKSSRGLSSSSNASQTFANSQIQDKYNAKFVNVRESFDSEDSPNSTPIIIGFDATGSMGYLANEIATNSLNETIMQILSKKPVTDPHMLCSAFRDNNSPLQVTQFEADIRVVEQLLDFSLGGGNRYGYDTVLWYFAAKHTKIDCYDKRGKKGILIGIGDEICGGNDNLLSKENIKKLFDDDVNVDSIAFDELYKMASEKYEIAHIVVGSDYRFTPGGGESYSGWQQNMPGRVAKLHEKNIGELAEVIVAIIQIMTGTDKDEALSQVEESKRSIVSEALEDFATHFVQNADTSANNSSESAKPTNFAERLINGIFGNRK